MFGIFANVSWTATSNETWLKLSSTSGTGSEKITLTAEANTATTERTANVTVTGTGLTAKTIVVTQAAAPLALAFPITFETGTYAFTDFDGGAATVIANPQANGINTSAKVGQMIKSTGAIWGGSWIDYGSAIDFTTNKTFRMKVFSPRAGIQVLFKVENATNPGINFEKSANTTVANAWEELTFDYKTVPTDKSFHHLVLIFDMGTVGDGTANFTFLFDDITLTNTAGSGLDVYPATLTLEAAANSTKTFEITSNVNWTVASNQTWLTVSSLIGSNNSTITLTATENTGTARNAIVTVSGTGVTAKTVAVKQNGLITANQIDLPVTFDVAGIDYTVTDFGNSATIDDVDPTDPQNKVKKTTKTTGAETWAGTTMGTNKAGFATKIPFKAGESQMSVRVYSPAASIPVRLKVEDHTNNGVTVETEAKTTVANKWEILNFDFAKQATGTATIDYAKTYDMASIFFDFGKVGTGSIFYWDDVKFGATVTPTGTKLPLDFETVAYTFTDFDGGATTIIANPQSNSINTSAKVGKMIKSAGQPWGGSWLALDAPIDFSLSKTFKMKVYAPKVGTKVLLKVENLTEGSINFQTEVATTTANAWEELTFDFGAINLAKTYQKVIVIFDNGTMGDGSANFTYLYDDINLFVPAGNVLNVSPASLTIANAAGSAKTFDITSNILWTAASDQPWLTLSSLGGTGNATITATASANTAATARTATITVSGAGVTAKTIAVTQDGTAAKPQFPIDFETIGHDWAWTIFENGSNAPELYSVVANPSATGINTSAKVAKYVANAGGQPWAGLWSANFGKFTLTADNCKIKLMVYKDVKSDFDLKFENDDKSVEFEVKVPNTVVNQWEELTFDFTAHIGKTVTKIVIIPDFPATRTAGSTNYFDNIRPANLVANNLTVSATTLSIAAAANSAKTFDITSNVAWTAASDQPWLTLSSTGGSGNATITATAEANTAATARTATITVSGTGVAAKTIAVTQEGTAVKPQFPIDFETVGQDWAWTLFENGDNAPTLYSVVANPSATGINTSSHVAKYVVNTGGQPWAGLWSANLGSFTLTADNCKIKLMVYKDVKSDFDLKFENNDASVAFEVKVANTVVNQWEELTFDFTAHIGKTVTKIVIIPDFPATRTAGSTNYFDNIRPATAVVSALSVSPASLTIAAAANSTKTFNITSNVNWTVASNQGWLTVSSPSGSNNSTITLTATANPTTATRNATVTVTGTGVTAQTIAVTQDAAAVVLTVSPATLTIAATANSKQTFNVTSNTNWTVASNQTWLTVSSASGVNNSTITVTAAVNPTAATRTATVTVTVTGVAAQTVTVTQDAGTNGVNDVTENTLSIYPNPVNNELFISNLCENATISIFDLNGKLLLNKILKSANEKIDVSTLHEGLYIIKVSDRKGVKTNKFIKE